jgi:hypothetical protein
VARFARRYADGGPQFCGPSRLERAGRAHPQSGSDGKVVFPDRAAAEAAAAELVSLGARPMRAYRCPRSRRGHHHLTADVDRAGR